MEKLQQKRVLHKHIQLQELIQLNLQQQMQPEVARKQNGII